jgi:hyperosmotically inducible periplasmic protein
MKTLRIGIATAVVALALVLPVAAAPAAGRSDLDSQRIGERVRKELVTLPWYGVFDNLAYSVNGATVTLYGQVVRPSTRSGAEARVKKIRGVETVVNNIRVLPTSPSDDRIRRVAYRQIFGTASLYRYSMGANPSLHIIVDRGRITLEGAVNNKMDAQLAYMAARQIPGVFDVTNNLRVPGRNL